MEVSTIHVERRTAKGRNQVRRIREQGKVPAILYGKGGESLSLAVLERDLARHVRQHHKVFKLAMEGKEQAIFLRDIQWDCLTDRALHVDFVRIDLLQPLQVMVELKYIGHPVGIGKGGRLVHDANALLVTCLPTAIPEVIELRIEHLDLSEKVLAQDVELPDGISLAVPGDQVICHLTGDETLLEEEPAEGEAIGDTDTDSPGEG